MHYGQHLMGGGGGAGAEQYRIPLTILAGASATAYYYCVLQTRVFFLGGQKIIVVYSTIVVQTIHRMKTQLY